ncbi:MAG: OmpA family protein [Planctomycetes bacterium]|nr:OmpA family protein [Planctomycetota bacterium]
MIKAQYAMRYKQGEDPYGDERIKRISGKHVVTIYYDPLLKKPSFMSDQMEEDYQMADDQSVSFKGFILTWFDSIAAMDRTRIAEGVKQTLKESGVEDVTVEEKSEGVALTLNKIHFIAEQAVVLPEEKSRLKALAGTLEKIAGRSFLVVGHTARVGTEESQYELSMQRAKAIVDYLVSQGLEAERFIYEGRGGTQPVAPNDTEENLAKNRRVEIIILED